MRKKVYLLLGIIGLYLISSFCLSLVYGPSFHFLSGEDCWVPDGAGGWIAHGHPSDPEPTQPSTNIHFILQYLPIMLPTVLLVLFTLTPMRRKLD
jgi:hypothetical protein